MQISKTLGTLVIIESPKGEVNSNVSHQLEQSYAQLEPSSSSSVLQESSLESGSVTSSASHIKVKKNRFPKESFYNLTMLDDSWDESGNIRKIEALH